MGEEHISLPRLLVHDDGEWRDNAMCRYMGNELFFNYGKKRGKAAQLTIQEAVRVCRVCPVQKQCLNFAVSNNIMDGIWGGMTPQERATAGFCNGSPRGDAE